MLHPVNGSKPSDFLADLLRPFRKDSVTPMVTVDDFVAGKIPEGFFTGPDRKSVTVNSASLQAILAECKSKLDHAREALIRIGEMVDAGNDPSIDDILFCLRDRLDELDDYREEEDEIEELIDGLDGECCGDRDDCSGCPKAVEIWPEVATLKSHSILSDLPPGTVITIELP